MNINWMKIGWVVLAVDLIAVNAALIYIVLGGGGSGAGIAAGGGKTAMYVDECGEECRKQIRLEADRITAGLEAKVSPATAAAVEKKIEPMPTPTPRVVFSQPGIRPKVRTVQYVTIPGAGSSRTMTWENISGTDFYFDKSDYPGLVEVYFEATVNLVNGNGRAYVRLFDAANSIGIDGSEVNTQSQSKEVVVSGKLNFWAGKNLIRVQAKTLTADTAVYSSGRLRIVTEN